MGSGGGGGGEDRSSTFWTYMKLSIKEIHVYTFF